MTTSDSASPPEQNAEQLQQTSGGLTRSVLDGKSHRLADTFKDLHKSSKTSISVFNEEKNWFGARLEVSENEGSGHWEFCQFADDFYLVVSSLKFTQPRGELLPGDDLLEFHIKLSGHLKIKSSPTQSIDVNAPSLLVWSQPEGVDSDEVMSVQEESSVTLYFKPSYILRNFVSSEESIPVHLARFFLEQSKDINYCQLPLYPEVLDAASLIINPADRLKGLIWLNYLHAKSEELMCHIISSFDTLASADQKPYNKIEIKQLEQAKTILAEEFFPPPTIKQIARTIGTNDTKLKHGFKVMFGETMFEYRNRHRMKKAKELIKDGISISQVAERVGYQYQTSFTNAFKSHFGITPKDFRKTSQ